MYRKHPLQTAVPLPLPPGLIICIITLPTFGKGTEVLHRSMYVGEEEDLSVLETGGISHYILCTVIRVKVALA